MKRFLLFAASLLVTAGAFAQTPAADPMQDPSALTSALFKALEAEDGAAAAKLITDDFTITSFDGQSADKDLLGQALGGGFLVIDKATATNLQTRTYNADAAVVTGSSSFKGNLQGQAFDQAVVFTVVCIKQGAGWKAAILQFTPTK